ncbi:MAG TPA: M20/M25/M40 family metallo-hydrolase [Longimicrobiaceae bacterium]|nr:M20/M25/M40 family metallo-hydrolase [Longimicrobiaceae bacterium]
MQLNRLLAHPAVARARALIHESDAETLREQVELVRVPAPSFAEEERGARVRARFAELGLAEAGCDEVGNVLARLPRPAEPGAAPVVVSAHLDTVFAAGTDLTPRHEGDRVYAPGITDNTRGLAALLALARVLRGAGIRTRRPLLFVATVGEEGIGDLRGVKHLFREGSPLRDAAAFLSLDGSGTGRIVHRAIGSRRLRVTVRGPGGHSWADRGAPNPVQALSAAVVAMGRVQPPPSARSAVTVARIGGGTSINSIPAEAWAEIDLRSETPQPLVRLEEEVRAAVHAAVEAENRARGRRGRALTHSFDTIGDRPSGATDPDAELVRAAVEVTRALGDQAELAASSTDSNVAISLGIPAVTVGAGGESGGVHTLGEWYCNRGGPRGIERALLIVLAVAGVAEE